MLKSIISIETLGSLFGKFINIWRRGDILARVANVGPAAIFATGHATAPASHLVYN